MQTETRVCKECGISKLMAEFHLTHRRCKACRSTARSQLLRMENRSTMDGKLNASDLVPCVRCGLRGHEPGDPEKCIESSVLWQRAREGRSGESGAAFLGMRRIR